MYTFVLILQVLACLIVIASILLQPAKEGNMALMSGGSVSQNVSQTHPLFKVTMYAGIFILFTSLILGWYKIREKGTSVIGADAIPAAPASEPLSAPPAEAQQNQAPAGTSSEQAPAK